MPTVADVEAVLEAQPESSGVAVFDDRSRLLAERPPAAGGGAVIVILGEPFPDLRRSYRPERGADVGRG